MKNNNISIIKIDSLPLLIGFKQASKFSGIPEWTLRKYEFEGKIPGVRRIGSRVYLNTKKFLDWLCSFFLFLDFIYIKPV